MNQSFFNMLRPTALLLLVIASSPSAVAASQPMPPVPDPASRAKCAPPPATVLSDTERTERLKQPKPDADLVADAVRRAQIQFPELKCK
jgi:hypothetical protein